jgi:uncharacterized protein YjbI with pentapeptide repeats
MDMTRIKPYANLSSANLSSANLSSADLTGANLRYANLSSTNFSSANLSSANLSLANLSSANLSSANLSGANLRYANLTGANLRNANLRYADLTGANLTGAKLPHFQIPQESDLTVYKKLSDNIVAKLLVPAEAKRTSTPIGRKCRAEFAKVLEIYCSESLKKQGVASDRHKATLYKEGEIVRPNAYNDDIRVECTNGIHFFLTREEAEEY